MMLKFLFVRLLNSCLTLLYVRPWSVSQAVVTNKISNQLENKANINKANIFEKIGLFLSYFRLYLKINLKINFINFINFKISRSALHKKTLFVFFINMLIGSLIFSSMHCAAPSKQEAASALNLTPKVLISETIAIWSILGTEPLILEVGLINALVKLGTFKVASKVETLKLKENHPEFDLFNITLGVNERLLSNLNPKIGYLQIKELKFEALQSSGAIEKSKTDETWEAEQGKLQKLTQIYKTKTLEGEVKFEVNFLIFDNNKKNWVKIQKIAQSARKVVVSEEQGALHLPPKLSFLQKLTQESFEQCLKAMMEENSH